MSNESKYSKELENILDWHYTPTMHWKRYNRANVLKGMHKAYELGRKEALSEKEEDSKQNAIDYADWLLNDFEMGVFEDGRSEDLGWKGASGTMYTTEQLYKDYLENKNLFLNHIKESK